MRRPRFEPVGLVGCVVVAVVFGFVVSRVTGRVVNWFVMTDELTYERLAIAVARSGSLLPRIDGDVILNVNYLYPLLIAPLYGDGDVGASLVAAHRLNAFVITSAAVPVYLLARWSGVGPLLSLATGAVAAAVPWIVYSSFLLTEVLAYPVFCWAALAITVAVARRSPWWDIAALAAIAVAMLTRTQFAVLLAVLAVAVVAESLLATAARRPRLRAAGRAVVREHPVLAAGYGVALAVVVAAALTGGVSRLLGRYGATATDVRIDVELLKLTLEHVAGLAIGLAILPFVLALAALLDRLRASTRPRERAFAVVAVTTFVLLTVQVASFNQRFGFGLARERYLFYVVPLLLVALAAAIRSRAYPRAWTVVASAAVCAAGFLFVRLPRYEKLNVDEPLAMLNDWLIETSTSLEWARAFLVVATLVAAQLLLFARALVPPRAVAAVAAAVAAVALPAETAYAFERLFRVPGTNGLPLTLDQSNVFGWIDRTLAGDDDTTVFTYPVFPEDYWAGAAYWWDVQFWNESVTRMPYFAGAPDPWTRAFDERTGEVRGFTHASYAVTHETDVRFWFQGKLIHYERNSYLVEPNRPWRAAFLTYGIYGDGWTRPGGGARIRVFADPAQTTAIERSVALALGAPADVPERRVRVASNATREDVVVGPAGAVVGARVCVPRGGFAEVRVSTRGVSLLGPDPYVSPPSGRADRPVGIQLRRVALEGETKACPSR